jgi:hypothetical protein
MSSAGDSLDLLASSVDGLAVPGRVAPDELLLVGGRSRAAETVERATAALAKADPAALVVDQSDGWAGWTLAGEPDEAFARLSELRLPEERPAFLQGAVAGVPAKVILLGASEIHLLAASPVAHHVTTRILSACRDLGVGERAAQELDPQERA